VPRLAALAGLSGRTLHRRCQEHLGITPAKLVQRLRVEHARTRVHPRLRARIQDRKNLSLPPFGNCSTG